MKENYIKPDSDIQKFAAVDVITTSGGGDEPIVKCSEYFFNFFFLFVHLISPCSISFRKSAKRFFCRLSERDFRRNPFRKEKAAAEAPLPPSLNG